MTKGRKFEAAGTVISAAGIIAFASALSGTPGALAWFPPLMLIGLIVFVIGRFL